MGQKDIYRGTLEKRISQKDDFLFLFIEAYL